jgi:peptidoglycan/LPS O-acetylase OafA/YrhL
MSLRFLDISYFAASTDEQPFLHLWSLGVEEQFYIIWPLLLLAFYAGERQQIRGRPHVARRIFRTRRHISSEDASFVFYMLPTRAGELLLALAAQLVLRRPTDAGTKPPGWCAAIGAVLVIGSCLWTSQTAAFPVGAPSPDAWSAALCGRPTDRPWSHGCSVEALVWSG